MFFLLKWAVFDANILVYIFSVGCILNILFQRTEIPYRQNKEYRWLFFYCLSYEFWCITALVPYDSEGPTTEVLRIMKRVVPFRSELKYTNENANFIILDYDGNESVCKLLLEEWFLK